MIDAPATAVTALAGEAPSDPEPEDDSIDAGVAAFLGVPLAIVAALVAMATIWLAAPWGPTTTEAGVVTEIDVDFTAGGQRMSGHWFGYVRTETGDEFRMNTPTGSASAEVGGDLVVERSAWTGRRLALVIDDRRHGAGQDLGAVLRGAGLVVCAGVVALLGLALFRIARQTVVGKMLALVIASAGAWFGASLLLV